MTKNDRAQSESWRNFREWVAMALNVFLAPDGLVATDETIDMFAQILECRAKELSALLTDTKGSEQ